ncbi:Hypothetical_protein [Hexamita inflata]|uniref:Hypothetical_protein n=1 Tax=Hexamita inflata TaxID=28002 RepID=A0AA86QGF4_9EUKA|nr:Hypothetical protein HINF_LOCUS45885 [Hexamita inflata]CAI9958245.1 Hypothetical protein HINF_LOCUS45890 [Hexamita inflata]
MLQLYDPEILKSYVRNQQIKQALQFDTMYLKEKSLQKHRFKNHSYYQIVLLTEFTRVTRLNLKFEPCINSASNYFNNTIICTTALQRQAKFELKHWNQSTLQIEI